LHEEGDSLPDYEIYFIETSSFDEPLRVGDALRWVGPLVWRVEEVEGNRVVARLWPDDEPYPERIKGYGPGEWPDDRGLKSGVRFDVRG
jgi:hypothetical protein